MLAILCLPLFAAICATAPARDENNVFPPYEPLFTPEIWKEIMEIFNLTKGDGASLFGNPLTDAQNIDLTKDDSMSYQPLIGRLRHAPAIDAIDQNLDRALEHQRRAGETSPTPLEELVIELGLKGLGYDEVLAILGAYLKG